MDDEPCVAPELCIRCRTSSEHRAEVVTNADACTCLDDETCPHRKTMRKKKKIPQPVRSMTGVDGDVDSNKSSRREDDTRASDSEDESNSSSSSDDTSCTSESESSATFRATTGLKVCAAGIETSHKGEHSAMAAVQIRPLISE